MAWFVKGTRSRAGACARFPVSSFCLRCQRRSVPSRPPPRLPRSTASGSQTYMRTAPSSTPRSTPAGKRPRSRSSTARKAAPCLCRLSRVKPTSSASAGSGTSGESRSLKVTGLEAGTTYHYRVVADNTTGPGAGADRTFTTFPYTAVLDDPCPNAHVRQQVGAAPLLECLCVLSSVSATDTGGYNVESSLVPGETPFGGYPDALGRVLDNGIHSGAIPGIGHSTNRGVDPYVATRGEDGWSTSYVGIPADAPSGKPFSSATSRRHRHARHLRLRWSGHLLSLLRRRHERRSPPPPTEASCRACRARLIR